MKRWTTLFIMSIIFLFLTGCQGTNPGQELFTIYQHVAEAEKDFEAHAGKIAELEQKEEKLYKQIIQDGKNSNENVQSKIAEVIESITERKSLVEKELQLITVTYEETAAAEELIGEIKEQTVKEKIQQVQELFSKRFEAFVAFEENYQLTIKLEKQLYEDLKSERQDLEVLETKISELNEAFDRNVSLQRKFSDLTAQLNEAGRELYQTLGISIE